MVFPKHLLISYVEGLELAPFDKGSSAVPGDGILQDQASVVGSLAVGFPKGLHPRLVADIQNSMLFAQFAANARYSKTEQAYEWYNVYKDVLENIGWVVHHFEWNEIGDAGSYLSVDKLVLELAGAYMSPAQLKLLGAIIHSLETAANGPALKILDTSSVHANSANFQVAVGGESGGNAVLAAGAYIYSISSNIVHVLFARFGGQSVKFEHNPQTMILNDQVYSVVRQTIIQMLGSHAQTYVAGIELSPTV